MYRIGIDVGSTYTKYCIMKEADIMELFSEKTPVRQKWYFEEKLAMFNTMYPDAIITSCGYGKKNIDGLNKINELSALAKGCNFILGEDCVILDIGGQDTKVIIQKEGRLKEFFLNDKCAAGSGMFVSNILGILDFSFYDLDLEKDAGRPELHRKTPWHLSVRRLLPAAYLEDISCRKRQSQALCAARLPAGSLSGFPDYRS